MQYEVKEVALKKLHLNTGQVEGLPKNPRFIRDNRFEALKTSIQADPEMLSLRELIVYDNNGSLVIIAGNMRYRAMKELGYNTAPCKVLAKETPVEKLRAYAIKDNVAFGNDDLDTLQNDWNMDELFSFGFEMPELNAGEDVNPDDYGDNFSLPNEGKSEFGTMTFTVTDEQRDFINQIISVATNCEGMMEIKDNKNENGAALFLICKEWFSRLEKEEKPFDVVEKEYKELRQYLCKALKASGKKSSDVDALLGTNGMSGHYFGESQWMFPSREAYEKLKTIMSLDRDYIECKLKVMAYNRAINRANKINEINGTL